MSGEGEWRGESENPERVILLFGGQEHQLKVPPSFSLSSSLSLYSIPSTTQSHSSHLNTKESGRGAIGEARRTYTIIDCHLLHLPYPYIHKPSPQNNTAIILTRHHRQRGTILARSRNEKKEKRSAIQIRNHSKSIFLSSFLVLGGQRHRL